MKRHGNLFKKIADFGNIYLAYRNARKGKSWQTKIQAFEQNIEGNLRTIQKSLINKTFHTSRYDTEIIHEPKKRLIYKLPFSPDRIVQHALMNVVEPIWEGLFISDSYSYSNKEN
jgi:retron-type reverse transcriptase